MRGSGVGDRLIALFLLGVLLFSPPALAIFSVDATVSGIPVLYAYLFAAWIGLIALLAFVLRSRRADLPGADRTPGGGNAS
ncbi:MAG TPA: hypothetical protein VF342_13550 [Alphaproteobacteria bacterium]